MNSDNFRSVNLRKYICPIPGIKVLVVDNSLTCLAIVSKMLHTLGYEVVTASLASEALSIVEEKKNELHLALVEDALPDMEIKALTEKIIEISDLPYFLMTASDNTSRELYGSNLCFKKPIKISDLSSLWKYTKWKIEDGSVEAEDVRGFRGLESQETNVSNSRQWQPFMNTGEQTLQSARRKEQIHKNWVKQPESLALKRKRLSWTDESRTKFLGGVELAGTSGAASPNRRHQLRNVPGLGKQNVKNYHLQQSLKQANPIQQHSNAHSPYLNLGSQHFPQTDNDNGKRRRLRNRQIFLCNCMHLHSLRNPFDELTISSDWTSTVGQNQLYIPWALFDVPHSTSGSVKEETCSETENTTDGKVFNEDTYNYCVDDLAVQSEMDFSTVLANDMCQQFHPPLPVPLPPSDEKEHGMSAAGVEQIDEVFYPPNGTQQFLDEDLNAWLSMVSPRIA